MTTRVITVTRTFTDIIRIKVDVDEHRGNKDAQLNEALSKALEEAKTYQVTDFTMKGMRAEEIADE